jgi:hypothetical protein
MMRLWRRIFRRMAGRSSPKACVRNYVILADDENERGKIRRRATPGLPVLI